MDGMEGNLSITAICFNIFKEQPIQCFNQFLKQSYGLNRFDVQFFNVHNQGMGNTFQAWCGRNLILKILCLGNVKCGLIRDCAVCRCIWRRCWTHFKQVTLISYRSSTNWSTIMSWIYNGSNLYVFQQHWRCCHNVMHWCLEDEQHFGGNRKSLRYKEWKINQCAE